MTEDEMREYDMVIMCAKALKSGENLQIRSLSGDLLWADCDHLKLADVVDAIMDFGRVFRVKPEPKTVRVRMYWYKLCGREIGSIGGLAFAIDGSIESIVHFPDFQS